MAIRHHGVPKRIPIDRSTDNEGAIKSSNAEHGPAIEICKIKALGKSAE
jgi:hypothetical protein